jgi:hypothetical protein
MSVVEEPRPRRLNRLRRGHVRSPASPTSTIPPDHDETLVAQPSESNFARQARERRAEMLNRSSTTAPIVIDDGPSAANRRTGRRQRILDHLRSGSSGQGRHDGDDEYQMGDDLTMDRNDTIVDLNDIDGPVDGDGSGGSAAAQSADQPSVSALFSTDGNLVEDLGVCIMCICVVLMGFLLLCFIVCLTLCYLFLACRFVPLPFGLAFHREKKKKKKTATSRCSDQETQIAYLQC